VIENLDLKIDSNEILAIVGSTGAGKTTIVNLLTRLYDVDSGQILLESIDLRKYKIKSLRKHIAVVPQNVFLFDKKIKENIRFGDPEATDREVKEVAKKVQAHDFIKDLPDGYETRVGEEGVKLSGGQKQLVSFARAMLADPDVLILDEATSSVDAYTEAMVQDAMDELLKDRTVLMIAHRFATLDKADRICVLEDGKLVESGSHEELMSESDIYRELYERQKK